MEWFLGPFFAFFGLFALAGFILWIWALVDCVRVPDDSMFQSGNKLVWVLIIVFAGFIGAILYLLIARPKAGATPEPSLPHGTSPSPGYSPPQGPAPPSGSPPPGSPAPGQAPPMPPPPPS